MRANLKIKKRLDVLLVERGLFPTRAKAQAAIMAGKVNVQGHANPKSGLELSPETPIEIAADACPYVSRGGLKLAKALDEFGIEPRGRIAIDLGSSTGGFSDCLLQRGADKVYAVDVGTAQLDLKIRNNPKVVAMEQTHARDLDPASLHPQPDLAVIDVSFISLTKVLPPLLACLKPGFDLIALVKPQFELEAKKTPGGIVKHPQHRDEAIAKIRNAVLDLGLTERGLIESPIKGAKGNIEYLIYLVKSN